MQRREFISLLGGAAAANVLPRAASAQQGERVRHIGVLTVLANDAEGQARVGAFEEGLRQLGWSEGRNLRIDRRWPAGETDRLKMHAAELVRLKPSVILAGGSRALQALQQETKTIPTVFVATDSAAVERSIQSLARPGGNVTGFTLFEFSIVGKMLETLKKTVPAMMRTAIIFHPDNPSAPGYARVFENAAPALNVKPVIASVRSAGDIERVINEISREPNGGLIVAADQFAVLHRELIVAMAAQRKLPVIYAYRTFIPIGGLMSYGANIYDLYRQAASYVDRILKGTRPDELPVQTPIRYELIINLKIAKTLGIEIPPQVLALADEVIE